MIEASDLQIARGPRRIIDGYSFDLRRGAILAILGANGVGKTTLLSALIGVAPLAGGRLHLSGRTGYVPQSFEMAFAYEVINVVLMGRARNIGLFGSPSRADYAAAHRCMALLGVGDLEHRPFNQLSGGQRQMVMIAQALASECDILILDEPCAALDFHNQDIVLRVLRQLNRNHGLTIIFTTHMPQHAVEIATDALLMIDARHCLAGPADVVLTADNLGRLYDMPIGQARFEDGRRHTFAPLFLHSDPEAAPR